MPKITKTDKNVLCILGLIAALIALTLQIYNLPGTLLAGYASGLALGYAGGTELRTPFKVLRMGRL